ncbi:MAG: hypothetical protein H6712_16190 [Myxococcales bacterium]|nr:hypothetical protein [Myxococcales bacterium]MCB9715409.1 hypothetical protein [Myxococcales bacterium]
MSLASTILALALGLLVGTLAAWLHHRAAWRASRRLTSSGRRADALLGLPLRIGLPVALLFPLAWWSTTALLAGLVAFGVVERIAVRRAVGGERA